MIILTLLWLPIVNSKAEKEFTFLFPTDIHKEHYKLQQEEIVYFEFDYSSEIQNAKDILVKHTSALMTPFALSAETLKNLIKAGDKIALQFSNYVTWVGKVKQFYEEFDEMSNLFLPIPDIKYTRKVTLSIDKAFVTQQMSNIDDYAEQILKTFTDKKTLDNLNSDEKVLSDTITLFEFLNNDTELFINSFYEFFNSLRLALQQFLSKQVRLALLDKNNKIDQVNINFLTNGIKDKSPIFFLKINTKKNPYTYIDYIPVAYHDYSLPQGFHYNINDSKIDKFYSTLEIELGKIPQISECLNYLNNNDIVSTIETCPFIPNLRPFHQTNNGIVFFNESQSLITEIRTKFDQHVENSFPFYIQFDNTISYKDDKYGPISITKKSNLELIFSSLSPEHLTKFYNITHVEDSPITKSDDLTVFKSIEQYLTTEYYEIFINVSFAGIIVSILLFMKKLMAKCKCNKYYTTPKTPKKSPIQKVITQRLNANQKYQF